MCVNSVVIANDSVFIQQTLLKALSRQIVGSDVVQLRVLEIESCLVGLDVVLRIGNPV